MKRFVIGINDAGRRLDRFLGKAAPGIPQSLVYKSVRTKNIKVNGRRAEPSRRLETGDTVDVYLNDEFFRGGNEKFDFMYAGNDLSVVYEDGNIMLIDKPEGLLCHPDGAEYRDTLVGRVQKHLYTDGEYDPNDEQSFVPALVNRLDRNTGGLVIAAKNAEALRILSQKIKDREIDKYYLCVVHGVPKKRSGLLSGFLEKDETRNRVYVSGVKTGGAKAAQTEYKVVAEKNGLALLRVRLLTGRTHQIRAQFAAVGHPLLGDRKYGKKETGITAAFVHQALYSYRVDFRFNGGAGKLDYLNGHSYRVGSVWFAGRLFGIENTAGL